jgi:glycine dehydrogenase subunit 1
VLKRCLAGPHSTSVLYVKQLINTFAREHHILAGFEVSAHYPELGNALMVCATETRTENDIEQFVTTLDTLLNG